MASATNNDEKTMSTDELPGDVEEPREQGERRESKPPGPPRDVAGGTAASGSSFFTVYKKGQGYWTRICTAIAAALILIVTVRFVAVELPPWLIPALTPENATTEQSIRAGTLAGRITTGVTATVAILAAVEMWRFMKKPRHVDFFISTDSEMKKGNWASRPELIGSTKVVIVFMLLIAALLFMLDMYFTRMFHLVGVLDADSPVWLYVDKGLGLGLKGKVALDVLTSAFVFGVSGWAIYGTVRSR
jgi:preprotein translocase SecE subunit